MQITENGDYNFGIFAENDKGYRCLAYDGDLGGGTLQVLTQVPGGPLTPVPDSKFSAATVDANGDTVQQVVFVSAGNIWLRLTGATSPDFEVSIG